MVSVLAINNTDKIVLVAFASFWFVLFILSRTFRWDELAYQQFKDSRIMWFWLDFFGVQRTRKNCLRFQFGVWIALLVLVSLGTLGALGYGPLK
jgi:hypothetical protein